MNLRKKLMKLIKIVKAISEITMYIYNSSLIDLSMLLIR